MKRFLLAILLASAALVIGLILLARLIPCLIWQEVTWYWACLKWWDPGAKLRWCAEMDALREQYRNDGEEDGIFGESDH